MEQSTEFGKEASALVEYMRGHCSKRVNRCAAAGLKGAAVVIEDNRFDCESRESLPCHRKPTDREEQEIASSVRWLFTPTAQQSQHNGIVS